MQSARASIYAVLVLGLAIASAPMVAKAASIKVHAGESIQDAVDAASPGDAVIVYPGDYMGVTGGSAAVRITKSLKLIAKSNLKKDPPVKVRILPAAGQTQGILVEPENEGDPDIQKILIKGFTVQGFSNNGIWLRHVNKFKIINNESIDNLENGIWPTLSANGLVKKNVSYGSEDSALWIEASENVRAIKNELHHSPTGLEITVSKKILAKKNDIHDNTVGVGLYHPNAASLPSPGDDGDWRIEKNYIHNNNAPNTAPPGSMSAALPSGSGILALGVDNITIKKNEVYDNDFLGVGVADWCLAVGLPGPSSIDCAHNPPINGDPVPEYNDVERNNFDPPNGGNPPTGFEPYAADLLYLAVGTNNNCFQDNTPVTATTFFAGGTPDACQ